jgi:rhodanese-related sulfurtransferase
MRRTLSLSVSAVSAVALLMGLAACSAAPGSAHGAGSVAVGDETILLDVRTAEEYATGRLEGARLLDFSGGEVAAAIPSLDPDAEYLVYCRSGNRSGQAIALMEQAGFTNLTDLGSLEQAALATGLPFAG